MISLAAINNFGKRTMEATSALASMGPPSKRPKLSRPSTPVSKPPSTIWSEIVTLVVGQDRLEFNVHKAVITASSAFFKSACGDNWNRGDRIEMPEHSPYLVHEYIHWCYTQTAETTTAPYDMPFQHAPRFCNLLAIYVASDFLLDSKAAKYAIGEIARIFATNDLYSAVVTPSALGYIYGVTVAGCALRRLLVDCFILAVDDLDSMDPINLPVAYLVEVTKAFMAVPGRRGLARRSIDLGDYDDEVLRRS